MSTTMAPGSTVEALPWNDGGASSLANGDLANMHNFYSKMHQMQDDVLSGRHESIKLPPDLLEKIARLRAIKTSNTQQGVALSGLPGPPPTVYIQNTFYNRGIVENSASASAAAPLPPKSSAFDPVLPQKTSDTSFMERKLKRQRLEQSLAGQVGVKRERVLLPEFDTSVNADKALRDALSVIKPVSGLEVADGGGEDSSSFDENDYYSSQAMSWSTEESEAAAVPIPAVAVVDTGIGTQHTAPGIETAAIPKDDLPMPFVVDTVGQTNLNPLYQPPPPFAHPDSYNRPLAQIYDELPDEDSDDDYSPPPPDANHVSNSNGTSSADNQAPSHQLRSNVRQPDPRYEYNRDMPSAPQAVIHSRIRSPFAPQPARVSPLALGKLPSIEHQPSNLHNETVMADHIQPPFEEDLSQNNKTVTTPRGKSPNMQSNSNTMKKRKRHQVDNDASAGETSKFMDRRAQNRARKLSKKEKRQQQQRNRDQERAQETSPEPYIKPEPISPPPVAQLAEFSPATRQGTRYMTDREDIQIVPPNITRVRPAALREREYPIDERHVYAYSNQPTYVRVESPNAGYVRRVERDDIDLRRVASLQHTRRLYSPTHEYERGVPLDAQPARAVSYVYPERGREPAFVANPRYSVVPRERSRSPVYFDERGMPRPIERVERLASPAGMLMPPPSRFQRAPTTIVEDRHGNRYFATPAPPDLPRHTSVAPPVRQYDDRAFRSGSVFVDQTGRASVVYEPSQRPLVTERVYYDEREQGPLPPPQRRYTEADREDDIRYSYRQREYSMRPPAAERERDLAYEPRRAPSRERGADAMNMLPPPQPSMPPPQRRRAPAPAAVEGRSLLRYDDSDASPQQRPGLGRERGGDRGAMSPGPAFRSYSVRPEPTRKYPEELAGPQGRALGRTGTAVPPEMLNMDRERGYGIPVDRYGRPLDDFGIRREYRI